MSIEDKYDFKKFVRRIYINDSLENVYDRFSKNELIIKWYVVKADYANDKGEKRETAESGNEYIWEWADGSKLKGKILKADCKGNFNFTFGNEVVVKIHLIENGNRVLVELTQEQNIENADECFENYLACAQGWEFYLINLKSICEGGIDLRERNPDAEMLVNI